MSTTTQITTTAPAALTPADHAALGAELTSLYHDAVEGNMRILAFGARMKEVESFVGFSATRGGKPSDKGGRPEGGLAAWLREYAPEISETTARRWRDIAEATAKKFKVANPSLVFGGDALALDDSDREKRAKVCEFVQEKSQRGLQLELKLVSRHAGGGDTRSAKARAEQIAKGGTGEPALPTIPAAAWVTEGDEALFEKLDREQRLAWLEWVPRIRAIQADLADVHPIWPHLDDSTKGDVIACLEDMLAKLSPRHAMLRSAS